MKTTHELDFEAAPWIESYVAFRVGTCHGAYNTSDEAYEILAIKNESPGNGHLTDVFEWFENSCRRDGKNLRVLEVWNKRFKSHLIKKRGFVEVPGTLHVEKKILTL